MPRITAIPWKTLECIFLKDGFRFSGQTGSHRRYLKKGCFRPVVIPSHGKDVEPDIILSNMRTAVMSRETYLKLLAECK